MPKTGPGITQPTSPCSGPGRVFLTPLFWDYYLFCINMLNETSGLTQLSLKDNCIYSTEDTIKCTQTKWTRGKPLQIARSNHLDEPIQPFRFHGSFIDKVHKQHWPRIFIFILMHVWVFLLQRPEYSC